jgi:hypothetical protein
MSETTASALFYMFLSACLGFVIGWLCGEQVAHRVNAKAQLEDLFERLEQASTQAQQLKEIRAMVNDAHKQILAVSKGLENHPH